MTKRAQVNRQARYNPEYGGRYREESRPGKESRRKGKSRLPDPDHNIVDLNAHSSQLATAYAPHRCKTPRTPPTPP
ncbi:MAG: hypothetical protein ACO280_00225, partial [Pseudohongiellaceae bacterium]